MISKCILEESGLRGSPSVQHHCVDVILPTVGQVESDAASDVGTKAQVSHGSQADVEEGHRAHS